MTSRRRSLAVSSLGLISLAPAIAGCQAAQPPVDTVEATVEAPAPEPAATPTPTPAPQATGSGEWADGTYQAEGGYQSPNGAETVLVSITISGGVVSSVEVTPQGSGTSARYQGQFAGGVAAETVGKPLDQIEVSRIAGSSLTSGGFNQALASIKADASR